MMLFSATLYLASTWLLVDAGIAKETVTTCADNVVHRLSCDLESVISVETSLYGRKDNVTCNEGKSPDEVSNTDCSLVGVANVVKERCNGKKVCELSTDVFGRSDPCRGTAKYLQTTYTCLPAFHRVICEHSLSDLSCDQGQVIFVHGADYGRRDQTTCLYGRPANQIQNTACSSPTSKVAESCQGKNSCIIKASNSVFGDPCVGTYKYLEVAYHCQYAVTPDEQITMLSFRLSSALLLATACLLMVSVAVTEKATTCDDSDNIQHLSCDNGVISVQAALYGRADRQICSEGKSPQQLANTQCSQDGAVGIIKNRCDGKRVCEFNTGDVRSSDPCVGIAKYLETNYTCLPANRLVTCEHSNSHLYCDYGQVIFVYGADYGRRDRTTCSYRRPASQTENVYCSNPTNIVAQTCNGKNSCTIRAHNSVFGDPCTGTFKYLEVAYTCEYL
ncbi:LOW QUALITY PROTEIN: rhamnose-binding lectin-like [Xiphophorus hellerii]|uniref:LOW QUALITY PROTEIN: rhamnose-binding lectin-like n=1 Tax=Xiphophorus hellerii TaxID=8084 RepID=UPI0013B45789|nr:LOW QUALITY PROTEIN: rhamnose-binding lectin-like [Xiphophorus hellerii]